MPYPCLNPTGQLELTLTPSLHSGLKLAVYSPHPYNSTENKDINPKFMCLSQKGGFIGLIPRLLVLLLIKYVIKQEGLVPADFHRLGGLQEKP